MTDNVTFRDVLNNPQDYSHRVIANEAIVASTRNGQLDLGLLASNLRRVGEERARHDPHYDYAVRDGEASRLAGRFTARYNEAAREVLGLTDPGLMTSFGLMVGAVPEADHGMHCHVPQSVTASQLGNLDNSLRSLGVTCDNNPSHSR